ncbi:MAG: PDZ domain-containing protein [Nitrososphaeraceae archaeon]
MKKLLIMSILYSLGLLLSVFSSIVSILVFPAEGQQETIFSKSTLANGEYFSSDNSSSSSLTPRGKNIDFGAWASYQLPLELMDNAERKTAITTLLEQGFTVYYFTLGNFESETSRDITENILTAADGTGMKMIGILLPPSEAGSGGNYDWEGWVDYLNSLKGRHSSLDGFVLDDFNWYGPEIQENDEKEVDEEDSDSVDAARDDNQDDNNEEDDVQYNVNFMLESGLREALEKKREDLHFYQLIYIEGIKTNTAKREFYNLTDGIVLASVDFYNITKLEHNLDVFGKVFGNNSKTIRYLIYTAPTSNFLLQGYYPPSDRLILATLSTALESGTVDKGIVIWRNTGNPAIMDYLSNQNNSRYLNSVSLMKDLQLKDENDTEKLTREFTSALVEEGPEDEQEGDQGNDEGQEEDLGTYEDANRERPWLGISITDLTPELAEDRALPTETEGVAVQSVIPGSPASNAGIKGILLDVDDQGYLITRGDVITSLDNEEIENVDELEDIMEEKTVGDIVNLGLNRNGNITNVAFRLESLPR